MRIHHLNCASSDPFVLSGRILRDRIVCHCLLIETERSLVLVDTGLGRAALSDPRSLFGSVDLWMSRPLLDPDEPAIQQIARLGYKSADVRDIILTHLDSDHAGGLADFPHARVHVHTPEHRAAMSPATGLERFRYRPQPGAAP